MAVTCPECGRQYDITLFQFGNAVKGRAFGSPLARGLKPRASTAEIPPGKPGAWVAVECDCGAIVRYDPLGTRTSTTPSKCGTESSEPDSIVLPIDGTLDLHAFAPSDVKELVPDYLEACREKGIFRVRIIHGKGIGELMRTVHAVLKRLPVIESYELAGPWEGGSGATIVRLRPDPLPDPTKK